MDVSPTRFILLADDDKDDNALFEEVLDELSISARLTTIFNGEQLMQFLHAQQAQLPDILFLDLNLPRINGVECLRAIKGDEQLEKLPVVVLTTSNEHKVINLLFKYGAQYYIRKPHYFEQLKRLIQLSLTLTEQKNPKQPSRENFVLSAQQVYNENK